MSIALSGSLKTLSDFFRYSINTIFYQRGIYPQDDFVFRKEYGISVVHCVNEELENFLSCFILQLSKWLEEDAVRQIVLVVREDEEVLERWSFAVSLQYGCEEKPTEEIAKEIQAIVRQITASVTFLPVLPKCTFELLVYTDKEKLTSVPPDWTDSHAFIIENGENVKLRSFSTSIHKINASVAYRIK